MRLFNVRDIYQFAPLAWLADYLIPANGLACLYSPTNMGKSFVALDLAHSVATGQDWLGRRVQQGPVVYVAAGEGVFGLRGRVQGWARVHNVRLEDYPLYYLTEAVPLHISASVHKFLDLIEDVSPTLVIFDTLARCFAGGDENAVQDMGKVIGACDEIRSRTGAAVLLVHHTGRPDEQGQVHERGSSALKSAVDTMIEVALPPGYREADQTRERFLRCRKQKDAEWFLPIRFELEKVTRLGRTISLVPRLC